MVGLSSKGKARKHSRGRNCDPIVTKLGTNVGLISSHLSRGHNFDSILIKLGILVDIKIINNKSIMSHIELMARLFEKIRYDIL